MRVYGAHVGEWSADANKNVMPTLEVGGLYKLWMSELVTVEAVKCIAVASEPNFQQTISVDSSLYTDCRGEHLRKLPIPC